MARELFSGGYLVATPRLADAIDETSSVLRERVHDVVFEAAFGDEALVARSDVIQKIGDTWTVFEVKSSFSDSASVDSYVDDLAYTTMVLRRAGLSVSRSVLILLSREYIWGMPVEALFELVDKTEFVDDRIIEWDAIVGPRTQSVLSDVPPQAVLTSSCRECDFFETECIGRGHKHTVLELPSLHRSKLKTFSTEGVVSMNDVPASFSATDRQQRVMDAARNGKSYVGVGLQQALAEIVWPCYYLDFETVATVLPLYEGHGCHRQVLTQFSIHCRASPSDTPTHVDYLADARGPDTLALARELVAALGSEGSVVVYSSFELTRIKALQAEWPEMANVLAPLLTRLVDLHAVVRNEFYHPDFKGSTSIKAVLPVLAPDLTYDELAIADGDTAIAMFARIASSEADAADVAYVRENLLRYCEMDTAAMMRLHDELLRLCQ